MADPLTPPDLARLREVEAELTPALLAELRQLLDLMTPAKWVASFPRVNWRIRTEAGDYILESGTEGCIVRKAADAAGIVALRNAAAALISAAEERDRLRPLLPRPCPDCGKQTLVRMPSAAASGCADCLGRERDRAEAEAGRLRAGLERIRRGDYDNAHDCRAAARVADETLAPPGPAGGGT